MAKFFKAIGQHRKAIGASIAGALTWATLVVNSRSGPITSLEWLALGTAAAGVAAVWGLTNDPYGE